MDRYEVRDRDYTGTLGPDPIDGQEDKMVKDFTVVRTPRAKSPVFLRIIWARRRTGDSVTVHNSPDAQSVVESFAKTLHV